MLYGGTQFTETSLENEHCTDVTDSTKNAKYNCTTVTIENFQEFPTMAYWLYRLTLAIPLEDVRNFNFRVKLI